MDRMYSKFNQIPSGHASLNVTPGCVVCEGGAFRGVYGEGVLDAMMEENLNMECTIGVSAGAMNGMNYVSGQIGRSARFNLTHRFDSKYVAGPMTLMHNKGLIGFDFVFGDVKEEPFDDVFFSRPSRRYVAVVTSCLDGKAYYMERDTCPDIMTAIQASASMPFVSAPVDVNGMPCLDGGCADKIPVDWAIDQGYEKVIVIKTQHNDFRKDENEAYDPMIDVVYRKYPEFAETLKNSNKMYNEACDHIQELEEEGRIFVFSPSINDPVGRLEHDIEKLGDWYMLGYNDAKEHMEELKGYLASDAKANVKRNRPKVICHMTTSIDGKVTGDFLSDSKCKDAGDLYYSIHRDFKADAFACGRVTMETSFTQERKVDVSSYEKIESNEDFIAKQADFYAVSFDRYGNVGWDKADIEDEDPGYNNAHIIEVVTEQVDRKYLAYLQDIGISYIFAGKEEMNIRLALKKLQSLFGIETLLLEGGSVLNGAFLKEHVVDELSLVQAPIVAGMGKSLMNDEISYQFELDNASIINNCLYVKYKRKQ